MEVLLTSEAFIKSHLNISENIEGHYLGPAIRVAQDEYLRPVLGDCLYTKLIELVANDLIDDEDNYIYKQCMDNLQYALAYQAVGELCVYTSTKISNMGVHTTNSENGSYSGNNVMLQTRRFYLEKANHYYLRLKKWLEDNRSLLPEYKSCGCDSKIIKLPNVQIAL